MMFEKIKLSLESSITIFNNINFVSVEDYSYKTNFSFKIMIKIDINL